MVKKKSRPWLFYLFFSLSLALNKTLPSRMKFRLDPFPKFSETALAGLLNARILIFSVVVAKITLDRLYKYAMVRK